RLPFSSTLSSSSGTTTLLPTIRCGSMSRGLMFQTVCPAFDSCGGEGNRSGSRGAAGYWNSTIAQTAIGLSPTTNGRNFPSRAIAENAAADVGDVVVAGWTELSAPLSVTHKRRYSVYVLFVLPGMTSRLASYALIVAFGSPPTRSDSSVFG